MFSVLFQSFSAVFHKPAIDRLRPRQNRRAIARIGWRLVGLVAIAGLAACQQTTEVSETPSPAADTSTDTSTAAPSVSLPSPSPTDVSTEWQRYDSPKGGYSVMFPGEPQESADELDTPTGKVEVVLVRYQDDLKGRVYLASHNQIPIPEDSSFDIESGLDSTRDSISRELAAQVLDEKRIDYQGYPGREFSMNREGQFSAKARIFYADGVLYQAIIGTQDENLDAPEVEKFLSSMQLKPAANGNP